MGRRPDPRAENLGYFVAGLWSEGSFSVKDFERLALRLGEAADPKSWALKLARLVHQGRRLALADWFWSLGCFFEGGEAIGMRVLQLVRESFARNDLWNVAGDVGFTLVEPVVRVIGFERTQGVVQLWRDDATAARPAETEAA